MPQLVVTAVLIEGRTKSDAARDYGVSRRWVVTLVQRYLAEGEAGLQPRSRRPHTSPTRTATELEDEIVAIRKKLDRAGHVAGAATIAAHLHRRHGTSPAISTIWRNPHRSRLRHPAAAQAAPRQLHPVRGRPTQRALAGQPHPLVTGLRHRHRDLQLARRPLPRLPGGRDRGSPCRCPRGTRALVVGDRRGGGGGVTSALHGSRRSST
jgi:transposase